MQLEKQKNETKRHEAWLVYGALMVRCIDPFYYDKVCNIRNLFRNVYLVLYVKVLPDMWEIVLINSYCRCT